MWAAPPPESILLLKVVGEEHTCALRPREKLTWLTWFNNILYYLIQKRTQLKWLNENWGNVGVRFFRDHFKSDAIIFFKAVLEVRVEALVGKKRRIDLAFQEMGEER